MTSQHATDIPNGRVEGLQPAVVPAGPRAAGANADPAAIRVVLADDHAMVRAGLRMLLEATDGFEVVAEAGDADAALRAVLGHKPDVLVLDLNMPGERTPLEALSRVPERHASTNVVVLTMQDNPEYAQQAMRAGALGYVLKEAADADLVDAIRKVAAGDRYLTPSVGASLASAPLSPERRPDDLSAREWEVLRMIALGHTNAEIAAMLFLSVRTVESHRAHIQQKIRLTTRAELVRYALDHGVLTEPAER